MKINYADLFTAIRPGFFEEEYIRSLPVEERYVEQVLNLHTWTAEAAVPCPAHITFGRFEGDIHALRKVVALVEEDWPQWYNEGDHIFCAFDAGQVVSFCLLDDFGEYKGLRIGAPGCVGTIPSHRKQGIGLRMVQLATVELQKDGYDLSWIHYTAVGHWYAKLGYRTVVRWNSEGIVG